MMFGNGENIPLGPDPIQLDAVGTMREHLMLLLEVWGDTLDNGLRMSSRSSSLEAVMADLETVIGTVRRMVTIRDNYREPYYQRQIDLIPTDKVIWDNNQ